MKKFFMAIIAIACVVMFCESVMAQWEKPTPMSKEWKIFLQSKLEDFYYSPARIALTENRSLRIWVRTQVRSNTDEYMIPFLLDKTNDPHLDDWMNYSHSLTLYECQCAKKEQRKISVANYKTDGRIFDSLVFPNPVWQPVLPESIGEGILEAACQQVTFKPKVF